MNTARVYIFVLIGSTFRYKVKLRCSITLERRARQYKKRARQYKKSLPYVGCPKVCWSAGLYGLVGWAGLPVKCVGLLALWVSDTRRRMENLYKYSKKRGILELQIQFQVKRDKAKVFNFKSKETKQKCSSLIQLQQALHVSFA